MFCNISTILDLLLQMWNFNMQILKNHISVNHHSRTHTRTHTHRYTPAHTTHTTTHLQLLTFVHSVDESLQLLSTVGLDADRNLCSAVKEISHPQHILLLVAVSIFRKKQPFLSCVCCPSVAVIRRKKNQKSRSAILERWWEKLNFEQITMSRLPFRQIMLWKLLIGWVYFGKFPDLTDLIQSIPLFDPCLTAWFSDLVDPASGGRLKKISIESTVWTYAMCTMALYVIW